MNVSSNIAAALVAMVLASGGLARGADQCGPFGDAPAVVNQGWFASTVTKHNPICFGGGVVGPWTDSEGSDRYACLYEPPLASKDTPLPLVVFLHGSLATSDSIKFTGLLELVDKAGLGAKKPGAIVIAPQGRYTTHHYPGPDSNALGWDNWYRQLNPNDVTVAGTAYKENPDAAAIDHFIDEQVATGKIDRNRIYVMGWSNGAAMALLYALNRPSIAAAAVYSAPDPFGSFNDPCPQTPTDHSASAIGQVQVTNPHAALMHVRNDCDIGGICPNGNMFATQVRALGNNLDDVILDPSGKQVTACDDSCGSSQMAAGDVSVSGSARGLWHHMRWPSQWNQQMLDFLQRHALGSKPQN